MRARLGGLRHGMLPGLGVAFSCSPSSDSFQRSPAPPTAGWRTAAPDPLPYCAIRIFFSLTRRPHLPMSAASAARSSALAPLLTSMLSASSLALTSGAASACLLGGLDLVDDRLR